MTDSFRCFLGDKLMEITAILVPLTILLWSHRDKQKCEF